MEQELFTAALGLVAASGFLGRVVVEPQHPPRAIPHGGGAVWKPAAIVIHQQQRTRTRLMSAIAVADDFAVLVMVDLQGARSGNDSLPRRPGSRAKVSSSTTHGGVGIGYQLIMDAAEFEPFSAGLNVPMFVLTVGPLARARPSGCLVGFATQCSISPVRFLVCVSKANHTFRALDRAAFVGLNLLGEEHHDMARLFGTETGDHVDKFARCDWTAGPHAVPVLDRCVSWFVGSVERCTDLGDHVGVLVTPVEVGGGPAPVLMSGSVRGLEAGHDA